MILPFCSVFPKTYDFKNYNIPYLRIALAKLEFWRVIKVVISMITEFHLTAIYQLFDKPENSMIRGLYHHKFR
jgi:hypothetical protein